MAIIREIPVVLPVLRALYERLGSPGAVLAIMEDFYDRMASDTMLGFFFDGKDIALIAEMQTSFMLRAMGARPSYSGKPPAKAHDSLPPILKGHFDRRLTILEETLRDHDLTESEIQVWISFENSFRAAIVSAEGK